jgi:hypothetical protein
MSKYRTSIVSALFLLLMACDHRMRFDQITERASTYCHTRPGLVYVDEPLSRENKIPTLSLHRVDPALAKIRVCVRKWALANGYLYQDIPELTLYDKKSTAII